MKRKMTSFVKDMSDSDLDILYDIICRKYKKFICFYRMVEDFSDSILKLKYSFSSKTSLDVTAHLADDCDVDEFISSIRERILSSYTCNINSDGQKVTIEIEAV